MLSAAGLQASVNQALQMLAAFGTAMGMGNERGQAAAALAENVGDEKRTLLVELLDEVLLPTEAAAVRAHLSRLEEAARLEAERQAALAAAAEEAEAAQPTRARAAAPARGESARARRAAPPAAPDSSKPSRWNLPGTGGAPRRPPAPSTSPANKQPKPSQGASVKETATPSSRKAADAGRSSPSRPASGTRSRPANASLGRAAGSNSRVKIFSGGAEAAEQRERTTGGRYGGSDGGDLNATSLSDIAELDATASTMPPPEMPEDSLSPWQSATEGELLQAARAAREVPLTMMTTPGLFHLGHRAVGASMDAAEMEAARRAAVADVYYDA